MLNDSNTICSYIYFSYCTRIDKKLKYLYTDTTCIKNKYGSELVKYNGHKKMNCTKVSFITDSNGIPINVGTCILCFFVILAKNFEEIFN